MSSALESAQPNFYVLYSYKDNRLSVLSVNLDGEYELKLREFLAKKIDASSLYGEHGNFCVCDFKLQEDNDFAMCYYYQYVKPKLPKENGEETYEEPAHEEYIVCLITTNGNSIECFQPELQNFCKGLTPKLEDFDLPSINSYLSNWYNVAMQYTCHCVKSLGKDIEMLFYVASVNGTLELQGGSNELRNDIYKFFQSCQLDLTSKPASETVEPLPLDDEHLQPKFNLIIDLSAIPHKILSSVKCNNYCQGWAQTMMDGDLSSPTFLKSVIENFKLMTVHHINAFKRLVTEAENNYYSLYRAYYYLMKSNQGSTILQHTKHLMESSPSLISVIKVLEDFIATKAIPV